MKVQAFIYKKKVFAFLSFHHCVKMQSQFLNVRNENGHNTNLAHTKMWLKLNFLKNKTKKTSHKKLNIHY
jgi:hypothetical protein